MASLTTTLQCYINDSGNSNCYGLFEMEVTSLPSGTDDLVVEVQGGGHTFDFIINRSRSTYLTGETFTDEPTAGISLDTQQFFIATAPGMNMTWGIGRGYICR